MRCGPISTRAPAGFLVSTFLVLATASCGDSGTAPKGNTAPVANAGPDRTATVGQMVQLNGSATDADGDVLTYLWAITTMPAGSSTTVSNSNQAAAAIIPDVGGQYVLTLTVSDGKASHSDACTLTVNTLPVANAGADMTASVGQVVQLHGSATDADGDVLTYAWTFASRPAGSTATLQDATTASPTFTPDVAGTFVAQLVASDGKASSAPDQVVITASLAQTPLYLTLSGLSNTARTSGYVAIILHGSGAFTEFAAILGSGIAAGRHGFRLWFGAGSSTGQTGTFVATTMIEHNGVRTTLASHTFSVPYDPDWVEYTAEEDGIAGGTAGDQIILRLTMSGVSLGAVAFGVPPSDSNIRVPGNVTVSPLPSPSRAPGDGQGRVQVRISDGLLPWYSGG